MTDLLLADPSEIARKCKLQHATVVQLLDTLCGEFTPTPRTLESFVGGLELFTSGDYTLDTALGGGIRTGMVWEIVGERLELLSSSPCLSSYYILTVLLERVNWPFRCP